MSVFQPSAWLLCPYVILHVVYTAPNEFRNLHKNKQATEKKITILLPKLLEVLHKKSKYNCNTLIIKYYAGVSS